MNYSNVTSFSVIPVDKNLWRLGGISQWSSTILELATLTVYLLICCNTYCDLKSFKGVRLDWIKHLKNLSVFIGKSLLFILLIPQSILLFPLCFIYRRIVQSWLQWSVGPDFRGLVQGPDVIWTLEKPESRSIICGLVTIPPFEEPQGNPLCFMQKLAVDTLMVPTSEFKLTSLREKSRLGYFYWRQEKQMDVDQVVKHLDLGNQSADILSKDALFNAIGSSYNNPMPYNDRGTWEILVGNRLVTLTGDVSHAVYPIMFRVHHSVGDGFKLLEILSCALSGPQSTPIPMTLAQTPRRKCLSDDEILDLNGSFQQKIIRRAERVITRGLKGMEQALSIPAIALDQLLFRPPKDMVLYGHPLCGRKLVSWVVEEGTLLAKIRCLRSEFPDISVTKFLLTALTLATRRLYEKRGLTPPASVRIVMPTRAHLQTLQQNPQLDNNFCVACLDLPVGTEQVGILMKKIGLDLERVRGVECWVNYLLLRYMSDLLPLPLQKILLGSGPCCMVVSNIPGPQFPVTLGGSVIQDMAFWIPHRGMNGMGISIMSYCGKIGIGISVDESLMKPDGYEVNEFVSEIINSMDTLMEFITV